MRSSFQFLLMPLLAVTRIASQPNENNDGNMVSSMKFINNDRGNSMVSNQGVASCSTSYSEFIKSFGIPQDVCEQNIKTTQEWVSRKESAKVDATSGILKKANKIVENEITQRCTRSTKNERDVLTTAMRHKTIACDILREIISEIKNVRLTNVRLPDGEIVNASPDLKSISFERCFNTSGDEINNKILECRKYLQTFKANNKYGDQSIVKQNNVFINNIIDDLDLLSNLFRQVESKEADIVSNLQRHCNSERFSPVWDQFDAATLTLNKLNKVVTQLEENLQSLNTLVIPPPGPIRA
ncbi:hypothetical protein L579_3483 [Pantoea sp. AS-PWVM4]|uniref:hypothetical protein n=1 Tax=Pantoea sp. AS-PWVM4 TaxID=1332069 RepID=UPI0003AC7797|nr:hypothetical protein [Pantoea sp. AS-PWVM4]ERK17602.1 hypothetical protein L579_3483 [Pantoea sp. AS-PWVM4]